MQIIEPPVSQCQSSLCVLKASEPLHLPNSIGCLFNLYNTHNVWCCGTLTFTGNNGHHHQGSAVSSVEDWGFFLWPHNVSSGRLLTASLCMSCSMLPLRDRLWMCLCWLMPTLRMNKVGHSVFMQVDEETLSATFCARLPAHLVWSGLQMLRVRSL